MKKISRRILTLLMAVIMVVVLMAVVMSMMVVVMIMNRLRVHTSTTSRMEKLSSRPVLRLVIPATTAWIAASIT